jgi:hypothetical protein
VDSLIWIQDDLNKNKPFLMQIDAVVFNEAQAADVNVPLSTLRTAAA